MGSIPEEVAVLHHCLSPLEDASGALPPSSISAVVRMGLPRRSIGGPAWCRRIAVPLPWLKGKPVAVPLGLVVPQLGLSAPAQVFAAKEGLPP